MARHAYRILNVFVRGDDRLSGNPLCVFEDGRPFDTVAMQALARQTNLSETTFVLPPTAPGATARVRIFTPAFEMPFAGHPTLGTAEVVGELFGTPDRVALEMPAGVVVVVREGRSWKLRTTRPARTCRPTSSPAEIALALGLSPDALAGDPLWVDTGSEQLVVPVRSPEDVRGAQPVPALLAKHATSPTGREAMAYPFARDASSKDGVRARFFFLSGSSLLEDPATGSACANLGGYLLATGVAPPIHCHVAQGDEAGRPSDLTLDVDANGGIFVSGGVVTLGRGTFEI